ncbi:ribonuclease D [Elstera litoralis]|uniref:Ribonuclease D n=1 Tax=Elstera litoralis TaxID=552518 RepID=A0A0F3IR94_9PROT|nr:ribonuclease D [Elstera litoralis]KJV09275.1 ribonuclease D [Elstera litoralis]
MMMIQDSAALAALCATLTQEAYVTVDTEFIRDKTYWPQLCLVQVAGTSVAAAIDPLAEGIDLAPLFALMANPAVLKVFHAARQDLEIFYNLTGTVPTPLWDSQVAAMVCGFGESASYETLAGKLANARIDKSSRFTDWSQRPLTEKQLSYALSDVTHLRVIYEKLAKRIEKAGREAWVSEEMAILTDPKTYQLDPETAWQRLRPRTGNRRFLAILKELAAWREAEAQRKNIPRQRLLKDEALLEAAANAPRSVADLGRMRALSKGMTEGSVGQGILAAVERGTAIPEADCPTLPEKPDVSGGRAALIELLKVLLKAKCDSNDVAQKLVANSADIETLAMEDSPNIHALTGWRRDVFGEDALALKRGEVALTVKGDSIRLIRL